MKISIKNRLTDEIIFEHEADDNSLAITLVAALVSGADLSRANLSGADLYGGKVDGEEITKAPLAITGLFWRVLITDGFLRIGCQRHTHADWESFTDDRIGEMHDNALAFWTANKTALLTLCASHRGEA